MGGWWRWSLLSPDGLALSRMVDLLIFPCTIKSGSSLLAPPHPDGPVEGCKMLVFVCVCVCVIWLLIWLDVGSSKVKMQCTYITRKPRKGAAVIAASMHGFASWRKFKSPVTLTLTLDRVKVTSAYTVHVGLPAGPTTWL